MSNDDRCSVLLSSFNELIILASVTASSAEVASSNNKIEAGLRKARAKASAVFALLIIGCHLDQRHYHFVLKATCLFVLFWLLQ